MREGEPTNEEAAASLALPDGQVPAVVNKHRGHA